MSSNSIESLKIKAKILQKKKRAAGEDYQLKDAYHTIAKTAGFASWKEMKDSFIISDKLNPPKWGAIWKIWFANYDEAKSVLKEDQFLLPYRNQFFICTQDYINALGIQADDQDLQLIGRDWARPKDKKAYERILQKLGD